jgi:23S rRNA (cytidine1920-2'-O)/16S rRNA (cytidine1409-2'-O)-methyltransferase
MADFVAWQGISVRGVMDSPIKGPAGNVEALLHAQKSLRRT